MKRMILIAITAIVILVIGTCQPERGSRIDPVTGLPYPTLEPEIWEALEESSKE